MAFELDPLFQTETMAKILRAQGHLQLALKVCHRILEANPSNTRVRELADQLKTPFPRSEARAEVATAVPEDEDTEPGVSLEELKAATEPVIDSSSADPERQRKLEKLNLLLNKIQERS